MHYLKAFILFTCISLAQASFSANGEVWAYSIPAIDTRKLSVAVGAERAQYGKKIELGKWYTNFQVCKDFSDQTGVPCLFFYENYKCGNCWNTMHSSLLTDKFREFQNGTGKIIYCYINGNVNGWVANDIYKVEYIKQMEVSSMSQPAYKFMKAAGNTFPYVVLYNPKTGKKNTAQGTGFAAIYTGKVYIWKPEAAISWLTPWLVGYAPPTFVPLPIDPDSGPAQKPEITLAQIVPASVPNFGQYPKPGINAPYGYAWSGSGPGDKSFQWCLDLVRTNMVKPEVTSAAARRRPLIIICGKDSCETCSSFAEYVNGHLKGVSLWFARKKITTAYFRGKDNGTSPAACAQARAFIKEKFPNETADPCHRIYAYGLYEDGTEYLRSAGPVKLDFDQYGYAIEDLITGFDNDYDNHLMTQFQRDTNRLRELQTNVWSVFRPYNFLKSKKIVKIVDSTVLMHRGTNITFSLPDTYIITNDLYVIDNDKNLLKYSAASDYVQYTLNDGIIYEWQVRTSNLQYSRTYEIWRKDTVDIVHHYYKITDAQKADTVEQDMIWKAPDKYTQCLLQTNEIYSSMSTFDVTFTNIWIDASGKNIYEPFVIKDITVEAGRKSRVVGRVFIRYTEDAISSK